MNGPTAASPPPPPQSAGGGPSRHPQFPSTNGGMGGLMPGQAPGYAASPGNNMMMNMQLPGHAQQQAPPQSQQQYMAAAGTAPPPALPAGQMLNLSHLPPPLQQQLANLPPMVQQQLLQQYFQRQQQAQQAQLQSQQPPLSNQQGPPPGLPQQPFTGQQPTAQMLAHMNNMINGQQQGQQGNPAFNRAPMAPGQAPGKPFSLDDKGLPVHPSQMQNFLQAQARAQAQMQMQAAAAAAAQQQQQPQQQSQAQPLPAFQQAQNHQSPQHTQYIRPNSMQSRQAPTSGPSIPSHIPPRVLSSAGPSSTSSPAGQMPQLPLQLQHPPQNLGHTSQPSQLELQHAANAVAGPSNPRAIVAAQAAAHHHRRPSIDQIALMQRLSQMAQKGGLPIQSLFTKTSWMASSEDADAAGDSIPTFTEWDKKNLEIWMQKDLRSVELSKREKGRIREALEELAQTMIEAQDWLGPTHENGSQQPQPQFHVRSRKEMERDLSRGKRKRRPWLEFSKKQLRNISKVDECLIPIRLDLEHEGRKCSDTFTWNLNDTLITPATFADVMCEDLLLPHDPFHNYIVTSIDEQIKQFQEAEESHPRSLFVSQAASSSNSNNSNNMAANDAYASNDTPNSAPPDSAVTVSKESAMQDQNQTIDVDDEDDNDEEEREDWWDSWRKKVKLSQAVEIGQEMREIPWHEGLDTQDDLSNLGNEVPVIVVGQEELRITISLDIAVDNLNLRDQFEWDLSDPQNSPEEFAAVYCQDLGLPGEFRSAISHLIREQIDAHARSLSSIRHIRGDPILHDELRTAFNSTLYDAIRSDDVENWTPHLGKLDLVELEHRERERERQSRRQKRGARNNRRNVVTLPEREPLRTSRTIMPKPGAVLEVAENTGPDDPASIPTYEVAQPYPLMPVKYIGPPPRMSSPLRRTTRRIDPATGALVAEATVQAPSFKAKPVGKRRGRPPADLAAQIQQEGTPPPGVSAMLNGTPAPGGPVEKVKRPVGRPPLIKKPAGWNRIEMTTHENIIDGKWHCTNCGIPEPVAVGRRKGPAGPNTQCAECGKYFMSNKGRLRPCQYTTDPVWHQARLSGYSAPRSSRTASQGPTSAQQPPDSPGGSVFEPESGDESKPSIHDDSFDTSRSFAKKEQETPTFLPEQRNHSAPAYPPGAGKGKGKGFKGAGKGLPPFPKQEAVNNDQQRLHPHQQSLPPIRLSPSRINSQLASSSASPPNAGGTPNTRPAAPARKRYEAPRWLVDAVVKLQRERPDDRFEIIPKPPQTPEEVLEWRLKCLDCPGKVYKTGPDQTLDNFSAHLKYKGHRAAVAARHLAAIQ